MEATLVPVVIRTIGALTPKMGESLQKIPGATFKISVQKSTFLGTAPTPWQGPQASSVRVRRT